MKKKVGFMISFAFLLLFMTACGGADQADPGENSPPAAPTETGGNATAEPPSQPPSQPEKPKDPIKLEIYAAGVKPEEFDTRFRGALEKKFPYITFDYQTSGSGNSITDKISRGEIPDIIRTDTPTLKSGYIDLKLGYDLTELVKKYNYDLNRFVPSFIEDNIATGQTGALYGLPVPPYFPAVLYYNIDLFDKFGVDMPIDGMTWDEVYAMAQTLTRSEGGETFRGFSTNMIAMLRDNPYSLPILDPNKDELTSPETWQLIFSNFKRFFDIPYNSLNATFAEENNVFASGKSALYLGQHSVYLVLPEELNWDIVAQPKMAGAPERMGQRSPAYWSITEQSKHKDDAFQVIMEMLSDDVQMQDSRAGIPTTLLNKSIRDALGQDHPVYSTKNMGAISYYEPTDPTPKRSANVVNVPGSPQETALWQTFVKYAQNQIDLNTALREMDERLKQLVETEKSKQ